MRSALIITGTAVGHGSHVGTRRRHRPFFKNTRSKFLENSFRGHPQLNFILGSINIVERRADITFVQQHSMLRLPAYKFAESSGSPPRRGAEPWQRLAEALAPQFEEQTFALIDASQFLHQWRIWTQTLPAVQLFLPIKVNPDEQLLRHAVVNGRNVSADIAHPVGSNSNFSFAFHVCLKSL
jgi:hypothetical protein